MGYVANQIVRNYIASGKKKIMFVNIGTPRLNYDAFGPFLGSMIKEELPIKTIGSLNSPITALNVKIIAKNLESYKDEYFIIATDAALRKKIDSYSGLRLVSRPLRPGKGLGKELGIIGDVSLLYALDERYTPDSDMPMSKLFKAVKDAMKEIRIALDSIYVHDLQKAS